MQPSESFSFAFESKLIVFHCEEISKANFLDKAEVARTAWLMVRRGVVVCALCMGPLVVHACYPRHYRDEGGKRHYGWVAQGHCGACKVYPSLTPSFIKPFKHFKADVVERVIAQAEESGNVENMGGCAADASTMRRWVREFEERGEQAVGRLVSRLPTAHWARTSPAGFQEMTLLQRLARLLREYPAPEGCGVIGNANLILTTRNCGFL